MSFSKFLEKCQYLISVLHQGCHLDGLLVLLDLQLLLPVMLLLQLLLLIIQQRILVLLNGLVDSVLLLHRFRLPLYVLQLRLQRLVLVLYYKCRLLHGIHFPRQLQGLVVQVLEGLFVEQGLLLAVALKLEAEPVLLGLAADLTVTYLKLHLEIL